MSESLFQGQEETGYERTAPYHSSQEERGHGRK